MATLFSVEETHIAVFSGTSSRGTLVVRSVHHITSHFKGALVENTTQQLQPTLSTQALITVV